MTAPDRIRDTDEELFWMDRVARPDAPDVRVVTVAQLDRWLGCLVSLEIKDDIHTIIGDVK